MTAVIEARALNKSYGATRALAGVSFSIEPGRIVGLIGPNGAGKTTALKAILGLTSFSGELQVLGLDPRTQRDALMREVCFMADVAVLPRWLRVSQALDFVGGVHPRFDRAIAESFLKKTDIHMASRVRELSKGMVTQLHLALVLAIDARLLVLDEPTLGLDLLYRRRFYDTLLNDYFDKERTILLAEAGKQAQILRGEGDSEATRIFADAFGQDPDFFQFYRSMQAYKKTLSPKDTTMVLSPDSEFFRYFDKAPGR